MDHFSLVLQLVIPVSTVLNLTRERTAFIIPNAIGIVTREDKVWELLKVVETVSSWLFFHFQFVFGSLMSRDSTYRTMWNVWKAVLSKGLGHSLLDDSVTGVVGLQHQEEMFP
jgi:hypothetical protein